MKAEDSRIPIDSENHSDNLSGVTVASTVLSSIDSQSSCYLSELIDCSQSCQVVGLAIHGLQDRAE